MTRVTRKFLATNRPCVPLFATLFLALSVPFVSAQIQTLDKVVAIVDDDIILATELQERLLLIQRNIEQRQIDAPPR